ncbi:MAG: tetratricopeptide repeat protein [Acidobacteria bacterium]|nr:tetratricopeptide repeat protein [Acidobacteriota bacterium]
MIGKTISHYRILGHVGEGGMGVVYVAEDARLGRRVAVKIPHAGKDEKHYRSRFLREARAVSALSHKNIAAVFDYGETPEGQPFIVMELVTGQTLGEILMGTGLSLSRSVEIIQEVSDALAEAHRRGIVHRDVKPSNVIVNERGEVKVLDFGLAKQFEDENGSETGPDAQTLLQTQTRSDVVIGTPLYLSPEQARGARVDGRSDLFALGALLYECVAGRPAFSGANVIEIGAQVLHVDPPPPSQFNSRVPPELDRIVLKALAKKVEERYQTADEMAAELERVRTRLPGSDTTRTRRLATHPDLSRPSALHTISETLRRPRLSPLAFAGALALVLLAVWAAIYSRTPSEYKPPPAALKLYESGAEAMREGAYYKAEQLLEEAVKGADKYALARARHAEALMELDYVDRAENEVMRALPERARLSARDALYLDAIAATVQHELGTAVKFYEEIVRLNPDQPQAHFDLGRAREKNDEIDKAIASYTEVTRRNSAYANAYLRLGVLNARKENVPGAVSNFERAEQLYDESKTAEGRTEVFLQRGRVLSEVGNLAEARRELGQALELSKSTNNRYQQVQTLLQLSPLALAEVKRDDAIKHARSAMELALSNDMYNLVTRSLTTLASTYYSLGDYDKADESFNQALYYARVHKLHIREAVALVNQGQMRVKQNRADDALPLLERARTLFNEKGYRKDADSAVLSIGRLKRQKGDYAGAMQTFQEQLSVARQSGGNTLQVGQLNRECGAVLMAQERFPEAAKYFIESIAIFKSLDNKLLLGYTLLNQSNVLWRMGHYDEAVESLGQVSAIAGNAGGGNKELLARALVTEAWLELSRRRLAEAKVKSEEALKLGGQYPDVVVEAKSVTGLAAALSGTGGRGKALCEEAAQKAEEGKNSSMIANAQLALAEVLLAEGNARGARAAALRARDLIARAGQVESEWRALALAGVASRRAGDAEGARAQLSGAAELLGRLEDVWGAGTMPAYFARPDVQPLRKELGGNLAAGK